mmetsp:Transcript_66119/g.130102  ORF Transcript_66119/g.130102 Transcript_66119/m.130102 type:complete len:96 (-) Transcript_66119:1636-1923(-)
MTNLSICDRRKTDHNDSTLQYTQRDTPHNSKTLETTACSYRYEHTVCCTSGKSESKIAVFTPRNRWHKQESTPHPVKLAQRSTTSSSTCAGSCDR